MVSAQKGRVGKKILRLMVKPKPVGVVVSIEVIVAMNVLMTRMGIFCLTRERTITAQIPFLHHISPKMFCHGLMT